MNAAQMAAFSARMDAVAATLRSRRQRAQAAHVEHERRELARSGCASV